MIDEAARLRAKVMNEGAKAAREGGRRSENPYPADTEDWLVWRDGYEQQSAWMELGRGEYRASGDADVAPRH
ncbi:hypothetical protein [Aureimonas endophytica]|uniref:hypothetical protein n=1 Tax=Aureimonas endophytica TaxID=2027858 RepID=UPI001AEDAFA9|nr:hypothetical protein [Aureimonas endophytica]